MRDFTPYRSPEHRPHVEVLSVEGEAEERKKLLEHICVTEHGVAVCSNPVGAIMKLAAARITADGAAKHIPLVRETDGRLTLPLPPFTPSKIGFFAGYVAQTEIAGAFRAGTLGIPLVTARNSPSRSSTPRMRELVIGLRGIKPNEIDEQQWAIDINLWRKLGFDPLRTRGLFTRATQKPHPPNTWEERRLIVCPPDLAHPSPEPSYPERHPHIFHILGYEVGEPNHNAPAFTATTPRRSSGITTGRSLELFSTPSAINYHEAVVTLGSVSIRSLKAAFEVHITPAS